MMRMTAAARLGMLVLLAALCAGCMPSRRDVRTALADAAELQPVLSTCARADRCAIASPLLEQALRDREAQPPLHRALLLEYGQDALLARIHMIRAARESIELQSYIFEEDDAGNFVLQELLQAARRGVRVRILLDQLFSVHNVRMLASLARAHANFELRLYNPTFGAARTGPLRFVAGVLCCFTRFNQRMHNKLLMIDGTLAIVGGRNYQNRYFDWDPEFNYRDRDVLLAGPALRDVAASFDAFWTHRLSVPVAALRDVRRWVRRQDAAVLVYASPPFTHPLRVLELSAQADSAALIARRLVAPSMQVADVDFISDLPNKPFRSDRQRRRDLSARLRALLREAHDSVVLQTPYLVLSKAAQQQFRDLRRRSDPPQVIVSTNSLASTDAFPVYALSHKYKRRYLRDFGFRIHEYKPYPAHAPIDLAATGVFEREALGAFATESRRNFSPLGSRGSGGRLPLRQAGMRIGLHAKSMVIDARIAMVGTHNFDPRSDRLNTESAVLIHDPAFATLLRDTVLRDTLPDNAWTIARRPRPPVLSGLNYSLGKVSEALPLFDLWPWRYATSWDIKPGCEPVPPDDPRFAECYEPVGDFPEVELAGKSIYTRILTAFGAGLAPIL